MSRVVVLAEAAEDIEQARDFYDAQQPGIGDYCADSLVADPKFVDPAHFDFHLRADSPAAKVGFKPFDYTKAGVYGDERWKTLAASVVYPPIRFAPEPPKR